MITKDLNTEFWVISDTHLIADSLHDEGQAFSRMQKRVKVRISTIKKRLYLLLCVWLKERILLQ